MEKLFPLAVQQWQSPFHTFSAGTGKVPARNIQCWRGWRWSHRIYGFCQDHILPLQCGQCLSSSVLVVSGKKKKSLCQLCWGTIQHQYSLSKWTEDCCFIYNIVSWWNHCRLWQQAVCREEANGEIKWKYLWHIVWWWIVDRFAFLNQKLYPPGSDLCWSRHMDTLLKDVAECFLPVCCDSTKETSYMVQDVNRIKKKGKSCEQRKRGTE